MRGVSKRYLPVSPPAGRAICALILLAVAVAGCGYSGDGEFNSQGDWPFTRYELKFPEWSPGNSETVKYRIRGWRANRATYLNMTLRGASRVQFAELPLQLVVTIAEPGGKTVFASERDVFSHFKRMRRSASAEPPARGEWRCDFGSAEPEARCSIPVRMPATNYEFTARCFQCDGIDGLSVAFELASGPERSSSLSERKT